MLDMITGGIEMETLSWKIYKEEPTACSKISYALNKGNQLALRTTELTAMKVLSGELAMAMSSAVAEDMLFESIQAKVRHELDFLVDDPEFIEMFEYLLNLGGPTQSYVPGLLRYLEIYLEESERRLRPQAFQVPNRLGGHKGQDFPRARIALIKRAYRQKPSSGFCPCPETKWLEIPRDKMQAFEDLLHHFHRSCGGILEKMDEAREMAFLANVDYICAEVVWQKHTQKISIRKELLDATQKYHFQLKDIGLEQTPAIPMPVPRDDWISYPDTKEDPKSPAAVADGRNKRRKLMAPQVLEYDESLGVAKGDGQELVVSGNSRGANWVQLPWRVWPKQVGGKIMDKDEAEMAAALSVLRALYFHDVVADEPVDVLVDLESGEKKVVVVENIEKETLRLPPCVPKAMKLFKHSTNPAKAKIIVSLYQRAEYQRADDAAAAVAAPKRKKIRKLPPNIAEAFCPGEYYVHPEVLCPKDVTTDDQKLVAPSVRSWEYQGSESMQPFWLVRRLNESGLKAYKDKSHPQAKFNTKLIYEDFQDMCVGSWQEHSLSLVYKVTVPLLTNNCALKAGDELILQKAEQKSDTKQKHDTWRTDIKIREQEGNAAGKAKARAKAKASGVLDI